MTKKDFEAIAGAVIDARMASLPGINRAAIREAQSIEAQQNAIARAAEAETQFTITTRIFDSLSRSLADVCAKQNPRFQRSRFLSACGVADGR